jgi:hypothetical protein
MQRQRALVRSFGTPCVPAEHAAVVEEQLAKHNTFKARLESEWYKVTENGSFRTYAPKQSDGIKELRCYAEGTLDCSLSVALSLFNDATLLKTLDQNVERIDVLHQDAHNSVKHVTMKGIMFTAPREVVSFDHWRVDPATNAVHKCGFSIERADVPEHPDPSVKVRAKTRGWSIVTPDEHEDNKVHLQMSVDIDVRLEHVPAWVQRTVGGSAQKINAQTFAANLATINKLAKAAQRKAPSSHVVVNQGGEVAKDGADAVVAEPIAKEVDDFSDLRALDVLIAIMLCVTYSSALFFPDGLGAA